MNDETIQTEEPAVPEAETSLPAETEVIEATDGALIFEELIGDPTEETVAEVILTSEEIDSLRSDIVHADLFGSFLICGTLIGLALLRNIHGT